MGGKLSVHLAAGNLAPMQYRLHHSLTLVESPPLWFLKVFPRTSLGPHMQQGQRRLTSFITIVWNIKDERCKRSKIKNAEFDFQSVRVGVGAAS